MTRPADFLCFGARSDPRMNPTRGQLWSGTVTSQVIGFPLAHGRRVVPSGRSLSSRIGLIGSLTAGI